MARALAWHARGHRFDPDILHEATKKLQTIFEILDNKKVFWKHFHTPQGRKEVQKNEQIY